MKEFNDLLKEIGLTRKEFAKEIGITYKSMNVMLSTGNPKWVKAALIAAKRLKKISTPF
jgi:predicted transcriptional regulator